MNALAAFPITARGPTQPADRIPLYTFVGPNDARTTAVLADMGRACEALVSPLVEG